MTAAAPTRYRFGRFELHARERRLLIAGTPVPIGPRAFDLLIAFVERSGSLLSKDELLERVWPNVVVEDNALQSQVSDLRKILGSGAIATVSGRGYRFTLSVRGEPDESASAPTPVRRSNLPYPLTSFIGRAQAMQDVTRLLDQQLRLVTLTGTGGCGKTRLALEVAGSLQQGYPDGVWLVELAALQNAALVAQAVASVFAVREQHGKDLPQTLAEWLETKRLLLILDNAEHLLPACADLAYLLLRRCAGLAILVTSREPLGINGEALYPVSSLSVPDVDCTTVEQVSACEAAQLFIARARLQRTDFAVTSSDAAALASVCRRLDGIALAIELAAPRVRSMSMDELSKHLDDRFALLTGGSRTSLPRQRTLRSLIDWSYDLLDDAEKALLQRVSVFSGGWTLEAAQAVCSGDVVAEARLLELLTSLSDKNLVQVQSTEPSKRYGLLETVRHYARDRLRESRQESILLRRHLAYFAQVATDAAQHLAGAKQVEWLRRLDVENDNLRAALGWSAQQHDGTESGLRLSGSLWRFWVYRGHLDEGLRLSLEQLAASGNQAPTTTRARALQSAGILAQHRGDHRVAMRLQQESLAIRRGLGDRNDVANSLGSLGNVRNVMGDYAGARSCMEEALAIHRDLGNLRGTASCLNNLGNLLTYLCEFEDARARLEDAVSVWRQVGDRWGEAASLMNLAIADRHTGDPSAALRRFAEAEAIYRSFGSEHSVARVWRLSAGILCDQGDTRTSRELLRKSLGAFARAGDLGDLCEAIIGLAHAITDSDPHRAAILWSAGSHWRDLRGVRVPPSMAKREARQIAVIREALGDDASFDRCWREGASITLDEAVKLASSPNGPALEARGDPC